MKQYLYVYVPGFEYDSKGPLLVDAIKLDVTVEGSGELVPVYTYIKLVNIYKPANTYFKGNIVYRKAYNLILSLGESLDHASYSAIPRVPYGRFYDFITGESDGIEHHVVGIYTTPELCIENTNNFDVYQHDGLFIMELETLNTDLELQFTLYSKIGNQSNTFGVIEPYNVDNTTLPDGYVEIGKWILTYNPATSGVEVSELEDLSFVPQYFNISGSKNTWELPVNADLLVSDMSKDPISIGNGKIYPQYVYNSTDFKHEEGLNLPYRLKITTDVTKFYSDFYLSYQSYFLAPTKEQVTLMKHDDGRGMGAAWGRGGTDSFGTLSNACILSINQVNLNIGTKVKFDYYVTNIDVSTLGYLYNNYPTVSIKDVYYDSNVNSVLVNNTGIVFSVDTLKCAFTKDTNTYMDRPHIFNEEHFEEFENGWGRYTYSDKSDFGDTGSKRTINPHPEYEISATLYCKTPDGESQQDYRLSSILNSGLSGDYDDPDSYEGSIYKKYLGEHCGERTFKDTPEAINACKYRVFNKDLTLNNVLVSSNFVTYEVDLNYVKYPMLLWAIGEYSLTPEEVWKYTGNLKLELIPVYPKTELPADIRSTYFHSTKTTIFSSEDENDPGVILLSEYGKILVGMPSTLLIDLSLSNITYNNLADHSVLPATFYSKNGYLNGKLVMINTLETNLLVDNSVNNPFELGKVVGDTTQLVSIIGRSKDTSVKYDSSFCNDARFILTGEVATTIPINKQVNLEKGKLYVLRILDMLPNTTKTIRYIYNGIHETTMYDNKWLFYSKDEASNIKINWINVNPNNPIKINLGFNTNKMNMVSFDTNRYALDKVTEANVVSGIGLYEVDLQLPNSVTSFLKSALTGVNHGFIPVENTSIYDSVIFPAMFCAEEDFEFGKVINKDKSAYWNSQRPDYGNTLTTNPIYHYYNFKYLPEHAYYEVKGFYKIPSKGIKPDSYEVINPEDNIDLKFLTNKTVRK